MHGALTDEGEVSGDGTIDLAAGSIDLIDDGTSDGSGTIKGATIIAGAGVLAGHGVLDGTMVEGTLNLEGGAGITVTGGLTLTGASGVGPGAIALSEANLSVADDETLNNATISLGNISSVWVYGGSKTVLTFGADLIVISVNSVNEIGDGAFSGKSSLGTIINNGLISTGTASESLSIDPRNFTNYGEIEASSGELSIGFSVEVTNSTNAAGGLISCGVGAKVYLDGHFTNDGTIRVTGGSLQLGGTLNGSGAINLSGTGTVVGLGASLSYAGSVMDNGAILTLAGHGLVLSGATSFQDAVVAGETGTLTLDGTASTDGLTVDGKTLIDNEGALVDTGLITLGDETANAATLENASGAILSLVGDASIDRGAAPGSRLINDGSVLKVSGTGVSIIDLAVTNDGNVTVDYGALEFEADVAGTGSFAIDAGTSLEFTDKVASTQGITFAGGGDADLRIADATGFLASLTGFAASDTIDLTGFKFRKSESIAFTENSAGTSGVLTVKDGSSVLNVTLFGQYVASGFGLATDGAAGSDLTYTPPSSQAALQLAAAHH
jgi:hypothetical protein